MNNFEKFQEISDEQINNLTASDQVAERDSVVSMMSTAANAINSTSTTSGLTKMFGLKVLAGLGISALWLATVAWLGGFGIILIVLAGIGGIILTQSGYPDDREIGIKMLCAGFAPIGIGGYLVAEFMNLDDEKRRYKLQLSDSRTHLLSSLRKTINAWNLQVVVVNRLIDQAELGLTNADELKAPLYGLRKEEQRILTIVEYVRRVCLEGKLGTEKPMEALQDSFAFDASECMAEVQKHIDAIHSVAERTSARLEIDRATK